MELLPKLRSGQRVSQLFLAGVTLPVVLDASEYLRRLDYARADCVILRSREVNSLKISPGTLMEGRGAPQTLKLIFSCFVSQPEQRQKLSRPADVLHPHDLQTRRIMVIHFNLALQTFCRDRSYLGLHYVDINQYLLESDEKEVEDCYIDPDNLSLE